MSKPAWGGSVGKLCSSIADVANFLYTEVIIVDSMKVCVINNLYPPLARGGAEQVVEKTVEALLESGHEVVLVTLGASTQVLKYSSDSSLRTHTYIPKNLFFYTDAHKHSFMSRMLWHVVDMFHIGSARFVQSVLEKEKPDVVHTHNLMGLGFLIPRAIRKLGIRHVHTVHDVQLVEPSGIILKQREESFRYKGFPTKLYVAIMRWLMGSPDVVISPSKFLLNFYREWKFFSKSDFVQLRNPMTFGIRRQQTAYYGLQPSDSAFRFFYVGQVEEHKGVEFLVKTFVDFSKINPDCELHIVGDGSRLKAVRELAEGEERIVIHGRVGRDALPGLFDQADVVIAPSLCYENSPTVIFESFAFGVPVLASNIEGIAELIEEGKNGMTFEAGDSKSLQKKLTWCVSNSEEVAKMGERTGEFLEAFSVEGYVGELEGLYRV
jgi:glycosyltransferase involved in cell wall biosynthesis